MPPILERAQEIDDPFEAVYTVLRLRWLAQLVAGRELEGAPDLRRQIDAVCRRLEVTARPNDAYRLRLARLDDRLVTELGPYRLAIRRPSLGWAIWHDLTGG